MNEQDKQAFESTFVTFMKDYQGGKPLKDCAEEIFKTSLTYARSGEPVAWAKFAKNGNIRIWTQVPPWALCAAEAVGDEYQPLYTHAPAAPAQPDVQELVEALSLAENEMRYASWWRSDIENPARKVALEKAQAALAKWEAK